MQWHNYYYRMIGFALSGAGAGLVLDELIHGPFTLTPANHEFWGMILFQLSGLRDWTRSRGQPWV